MKKYIFVALLSFSIFLSPIPTQAASLTSSQAQAVLALLSAFGADSATIKNVRISLIGMLSMADNDANAAAIQSDFSTVHVLAEIYYGGNGNNSYTNVCTDPSIIHAFKHTQSINGGVAPVCNFDTITYAVSSPLLSGDFWCIDSTGVSKRFATSLGLGTSCSDLSQVQPTNQIIEPIAMCDYAPAPVGCAYGHGPNYNPTTQCGMVLQCAPSSITVLSPKGGESFVLGQKVDVKWVGFNLPANARVKIDLIEESTDSAYGVSDNYTGTGTATIVLPTYMNPRGAYKIRVMCVVDGAFCNTITQDLNSGSTGFSNSFTISAIPIVTDMWIRDSLSRRLSENATWPVSTVKLNANEQFFVGAIFSSSNGVSPVVKVEIQKNTDTTPIATSPMDITMINARTIDDGKFTDQISVSGLSSGLYQVKLLVMNSGGQYEQVRDMHIDVGGTLSTNGHTQGLASVSDAFRQRLSSPGNSNVNPSIMVNNTVFKGNPDLKYVWNHDLQIGSSYFEDISALQKALTHEGVYAGEITGGFYDQMYTAVKKFQKKYGIKETGYVGYLTRIKLNSLYSN